MPRRDLNEANWIIGVLLLALLLGVFGPRPANFLSDASVFAPWSQGTAPEARV